MLLRVSLDPEWILDQLNSFYICNATCLPLVYYYRAAAQFKVASVKNECPAMYLTEFLLLFYRYTPSLHAG